MVKAGLGLCTCCGEGSSDPPIDTELCTSCPDGSYLAVDVRSVSVKGFSNATYVLPWSHQDSFFPFTDCIYYLELVSSPSKFIRVRIGPETGSSPLEYRTQVVFSNAAATFPFITQFVTEDDSDGGGMAEEVCTWTGETELEVYTSGGSSYSTAGQCFIQGNVP